MLKADIDQLNKVATVLGNASKAIGELKVRGVSDHIGDALPGCVVAQSCSQAGEFIEGAYQRVTGRLDQVGQKVTQTAKDLQTTDADFAKAMHELDVRHLGGK
ncbi:hypothetical protein [Nocardia macrotermitis]|uniref:Excreted virulence factor EspC (Type VII ESX diderm) n=1 Tax=Nocardia macrotermitis TaxID=2585198 RepID=A0A7K0CVL6_9NOCA|nr:hypothetical protein [Nocardia macrotermitis]MQY17423.1 hypothetical protein [Nocardia macrotermitis]